MRRIIVPTSRPMYPQADTVERIADAPTPLGKSDSESEHDEPDHPIIADNPGGCFVSNKHSGTAHVAQLRDGSGINTLELPLDRSKVFARHCCGAQADLDPESYFATGVLPTGFDLYRRLGCRPSKRACPVSPEGGVRGSNPKISRPHKWEQLPGPFREMGLHHP